jgi:hypothetical protein
LILNDEHKNKKNNKEEEKIGEERIDCHKKWNNNYIMNEYFFIRNIKKGNKMGNKEEKKNL